MMRLITLLFFLSFASAVHVEDDELLGYATLAPTTSVPSTKPTISFHPTYAPSFLPTLSGYALVADYSSVIQNFMVPSNIFYIQIFARGAQGGTYSNTYNGGLGGSIQAIVRVTPGQELFVLVGGMGSKTFVPVVDAGDDDTPASIPVIGNGGWNGGGSGGRFVSRHISNFYLLLLYGT